MGIMHTKAERTEKVEEIKAENRKKVKEIRAKKKELDAEVKKKARQVAADRKKRRAGITFRLFMLAIVAVGNLIDIYVIGNGAIIRNIVIIFYISNECISIVENAGKMGVPVPKKLLDVLAQLKKEND